jgi:hypothetical protein
LRGIIYRLKKIAYQIQLHCQLFNLDVSQLILKSSFVQFNQAFGNQLKVSTRTHSIPKFPRFHRDKAVVPAEISEIKEPWMAKAAARLCALDE